MISSAREKAKKALKHIDEKILALKKSKKGSSNARNFLIDKAENTKREIESIIESQHSVSSVRSDDRNSFEIDIDSRNITSTIDKLESSVVHDVDSIIEKSDVVEPDETIDEIYGVPVVPPAGPVVPVAPAGPAGPGPAGPAAAPAAAAAPVIHPWASPWTDATINAIVAGPSAEQVADWTDAWNGIAPDGLGKGLLQDAVRNAIDTFLGNYRVSINLAAKMKQVTDAIIDKAIDEGMDEAESLIHASIVVYYLFNLSALAYEHAYNTNGGPAAAAAIDAAIAIGNPPDHADVANEAAAFNAGIAASDLVSNPATTAALAVIPTITIGYFRGLFGMSDIAEIVVTAMRTPPAAGGLTPVTDEKTARVRIGELIDSKRNGLEEDRNLLNAELKKIDALITTLETDHKTQEAARAVFQIIVTDSKTADKDLNDIKTEYKRIFNKLATTYKPEFIVATTHIPEVKTNLLDICVTNIEETDVIFIDQIDKAIALLNKTTTAGAHDPPRLYLVKAKIFTAKIALSLIVARYKLLIDNAINIRDSTANGVPLDEIKNIIDDLGVDNTKKYNVKAMLLGEEHKAPTHIMFANFYTDVKALLTPAFTAIARKTGRSGIITGEFKNIKRRCVQELYHIDEYVKVQTDTCKKLFEVLRIGLPQANKDTIIDEFKDLDAIDYKNTYFDNVYPEVQAVSAINEGDPLADIKMMQQTAAAVQPKIFAYIEGYKKIYDEINDICNGCIRHLRNNVAPVILYTGGGEFDDIIKSNDVDGYKGGDESTSVIVASCLGISLAVYVSILYVMIAVLIVLVVYLLYKIREDSSMFVNYTPPPQRYYM